MSALALETRQIVKPMNGSAVPDAPGFIATPKRERRGYVARALGYLDRASAGTHHFHDAPHGALEERVNGN